MQPDLLPRYAELHCVSNFSFLRGASHPEELVERAAQLGYAALAITDECSLAGIVRAHLAAKDAGLPLVVGSELTLDDGTRLVLYATDRASYGDLAQLVTRGRRQAVKGTYRLSRGDVEALASRCLALLLGPATTCHGKAGTDSTFPAGRPLRQASSGKSGLPPLSTAPRWIADTFPGRAWLAVELFARAGDDARLAALEAIGRDHGLPLVAAGDVHMHARARRALQDTLTAIRLRTPLAQCGYALFPNAERHLRSRGRLATLYPPELIAGTLAIADRCRFSLDELRYEYPEEVVPPGETPASHLRKLVEAGLARRYAPSPQPSPRSRGEGAFLPTREESALLPSPRECGGAIGTSPSMLGADRTAGACLRRRALQGRGGGEGPMLHGDATFRCLSTPADVRELIEHELALISELRYEPYFLTVHDIVAFARSKEILCQGRGSAANSAVCYALGITEVDPARMSMLFERFISRERNEPPDIDVDFEHQRREEVMQYVYGKYGRDRAALAATLITYRPKSAVRDVGKALGLGLAEVDRLAGVFAWWDGRAIHAERIREAGFDPESPLVRRLIALTSALMGFPRHLSQHVGGFVIARGLLERMVPVENAAMADRTVIQWDKDDLDAMGLLKVDCLALGMLSAIRRCLAMVGGGSDPALIPTKSGSERGLTLQDIPAEDPEVYAMIQRADTIGVFQIESRAQMSMLPRLKPANFYDLVIEVAIVRPGPIQGGMVHPYLKRRQGKEPVTYPSDAVRAVLERTLGVPIFQEQVMQLAIVAAGFSPGEADHLRRSMAAWRRKGGLEKFEEKLIDGMAKRGYDEAFARQIYQQILGFGEYGFPESHSASFSLIVYVSAWLKRYHPAAFTGALLNSLPMGFYGPAQLVADARRHGVEVRGPDVAVSDWDCALEPPGSRGSGFSRTRRILPVGLKPGPRQVPEDAPDVEIEDASPSPRMRSEGDVPERWGAHGPALRLGLRLVSGLTEAGAQRIEAARRARAFDDVADLARRARLDRRDLEALADAGALASLAGHRHAAVWDVAGVEKLPALLDGGTFDEAAPALPAPTEGEDVVADYRRIGLTLRRHPVALLREELAKRRLATSADILRTPHGRLARTAGIVTGRQRPDTASGVVFVTLEDETGSTNVIVWRDLGDRQRRELLGSRMLAVYGKVEREGDVVHLIAGRLVDLTPLLGSLPTRSRDFH
jgi:error-prone DNA polymerase